MSFIAPVARASRAAGVMPSAMNMTLTARRGAHGRYHLVLIGGNNELVLFGQPWKRKSDLMRFGAELAKRLGVKWIEP